MNVLLLQSGSQHFECLGFLLELLKNNNIYFLFNKDKYKYIEYFKKIYNFKTTNNPSILNKGFDIIIKLTSNEKIEFKYYSKNRIFAILHNNNEEYDSRIINYIILSPYLFTCYNHIYIFPIYNGKIYSNNNKKYITYIGELNNIDNDLINFCKKIKFKLIFIINKKNKNNINELKKINNLEIYFELNTDECVNFINKSKFILIRKLPYQKYKYTGSYSLAFSHNKPIILQQELKKKFNIPALTFEKNYSECINNINNMDDIEYKKYVDDTINYKEKNIVDNRYKLNNFIKNMIKEKIYLTKELKINLIINNYNNNFEKQLSKVILRFLLLTYNVHNFFITINEKNKKNNLSIINNNINKCNEYNNVIVWGTGIEDKKNINLIKNKIKFSYVRGNLSRELLISHNYNYNIPEIYGDPILLLPIFYKPVKNKKLINKIGIICDNNIVKKNNLSNNFFYINPLWDWNMIINNICSCKLIISSYLSGLIISDAYNIDNIWLYNNNNINKFKFYDYFKSQNRKNIYISNIEDYKKIDLEKKYNIIDIVKLYNIFENVLFNFMY